MANHTPHIARHYNHARAKYPYFADRITNWDAFGGECLLQNERVQIDEGVKHHDLPATSVLYCEIAEVVEAFTKGNTDAAIAECYDAVAVLLRIVDVLRGEQSLGKPDDEETEEQETEGWTK